MATPINQKIVDELLARLQNITTDNGYEFDVGTVEVVDRDTDGWAATPRCVIIEQQPEEENEEMSCPGNPPRVAFNLSFKIHGYAKRLNVDDTAVAVSETNTTENNMLAAIKKAIANNDAGSWHTFDGNAIDAEVSAAEPFNESGWDGGTVLLTVVYRVSELDPYVVG